LDETKLGPTPSAALLPEDYAKNNLPDILSRWQHREDTELLRERTAQSFRVEAAEIEATGSWDLSLNRYKHVEHAEVEHAAPQDIIAELRAIEAEIAEGLDRLQEMLA
jgi:type I restriction enzyme M protein